MVPVGGTDTVTRPDLADTDSGDHDRMAHYVEKSALNRALVTGEAVTALCGKRWVPCRDPERYPVCKSCVDVLAVMRGS